MSQQPSQPHRPSGRRTIQIVCHKGANEYAPENTYAAAQLCIDWGMDYVEIDVNTSKDGVLYLFHGPQLEETTNGVGYFSDLTAAEIDQLDAGSWFDPRFAGERVPRLEEFLRWIKGKAKVFLDVKAADLSRLIALIYEIGLEDDCFFWFGKDEDALRFRQLDRRLALKMNVASVEDVIQAHERYHANIVEVSLQDMSQALVDECRRRGLQIMIYHRQKDPVGFRQILDWGVDMVNLNHGDLFARIAAEYTPSGGSADQAIPRPRRVVLFVLGGCRADAISHAISAATAPTLQRLMAQGAWTLSAQTVTPTIALPCLASLFLSSHPSRHGITTNRWTPPSPAIPSLVQVISQAGYRAAAFYTWEPLRDLAPPGALELAFYRRLSQDGFHQVGQMAATTIARLLPTFAFVYLDATDGVGHRDGWMSPTYLEALRRTDEILGQVIQELEAVGAHQETVYLVVADHGGHDHGHGAARTEDTTIPWIISGPGIRANHRLSTPVDIIDTAPTILRCLGLDAPASWQGQVVAEAFEPQAETVPMGEASR